MSGADSALDRTLGALADPTRRRVIDLLRQRPHRASELADALGASRPSMSRHLRVLRGSGLVEATGDDDARVRIYQLRPEHFGSLRRWLDDVERFWTFELESFQRHVDRATGTTPADREGREDRRPPGPGRGSRGRRRGRGSHEGPR